MALADEVARELAVLHRGRGLHEPDLLGRMGTHLRMMAFGDVEPDPLLAHQRMVGLLSRAAPSLAQQQWRLLREMLWLEDGPDHFEARVAAYSDREHVSQRTVKRHLQAAEQKAAAALVLMHQREEQENQFADRGWFVVAMESHAFLSTPRTQFEAIRDIKTTRDGLREILEHFTIPQPDPSEPSPDVLIEPLEGCLRVETERVSPSTWAYQVTLPRTLSAGQRHRIGLRVVLPGPQYLRPYNALVALRQTRRFVATLSFTDRDQVAAAWRYDGVPAAIMEDQTPLGAYLDLNAPQPLRSEWPHIHQGLAYGIGWRLA